MENITDQYFPDNRCFGCGIHNEHGLKVQLQRHPEKKQGLMGEFTPQSYMIGFPGLTHGGAIYTTLDCLAAWTPTVLRPETKAVWVTGSVNIKYLAPARESEKIFLESELVGEGQKSVIVKTLAKNKSGQILVEGEFKMVGVSPEKFAAMAGLKEFTPAWKKFLRLEEA